VPISLEEALPVAVQIAAAFEAPHERGIVHRDLNLANIKLTADGQLKVCPSAFLIGACPPPFARHMVQRGPALTRECLRDHTVKIFPLLR